jgi:hypothetical protein
VARTKNNGTRIIINSVKIEKALLSTSHENSGEEITDRHNMEYGELTCMICIYQYRQQAVLLSQNRPDCPLMPSPIFCYTLIRDEIK